MPPVAPPPAPRKPINFFAPLDVLDSIPLPIALLFAVVVAGPVAVLVGVAMFAAVLALIWKR